MAGAGAGGAGEGGGSPLCAGGGGGARGPLAARLAFPSLPAGGTDRRRRPEPWAAAPGKLGEGSGAAVLGGEPSGGDRSSGRGAGGRGAGCRATLRRPRLQLVRAWSGWVSVAVRSRGAGVGVGVRPAAAVAAMANFYLSAVFSYFWIWVCSVAAKLQSFVLKCFKKKKSPAAESFRFSCFELLKKRVGRYSSMHYFDFFFKCIKQNNKLLLLFFLPCAVFFVFFSFSSTSGARTAVPVWGCGGGLAV